MRFARDAQTGLLVPQRDIRVMPGLDRAHLQWFAVENGFIAATPTGRYGDAEGNLDHERPWGSLFVVPGSGTFNVTEIGCYAYYAGTSNIKLSIWEHDAENNNPDTIVTSSDTDPVALPGAMAKVYFTYGTQPQVTGGTTYWICVEQSSADRMSYFATGGTSVYINGGMTYPTWPTPAQWDTVSDLVWDTSLYAVIEAAGEGGGSSVALISEQRRRRG